MRWAVQGATLALLVSIDRLSRVLVALFAPPPLHGPGLRVAAFYNDGFAFSLGGSSVAAVLVSLVGLGGLLILLQTPRSQQRWGALLMLAGGLSNIIDRLISGYVFDIVQLYDLYTNLADLYLVAGAMLLLSTLIQRPTSSAVHLEPAKPDSVA